MSSLYPNVLSGASRNLHPVPSTQMWGGATFDVCYRFLSEDPWERLRQIRAAVPNVCLQVRAHLLPTQGPAFELAVAVHPSNRPAVCSGCGLCRDSLSADKGDELIISHGVLADRC